MPAARLDAGEQAAAPLGDEQPAAPLGDEEFAAPLGGEEFAALIESLGAFESRPALAVATSGGPDSLCLCLLADRWARRRGGAVIALSVDHGLRPESAAEIATLGTWLDARGIARRVLVWRGAKPDRAVQAAARAARYRLLTDFCGQAGALHLLLGHQQDDQAETVLMRQAWHSGADGLAGMARISERDGVRLLRPLLTVPRARLVATLRHFAQPWIDDPSNRALESPRVQARQLLAASAPAARESALGRARDCGQARAAAEQAVAAFLAGSTTIDGAGFCLLNSKRWIDAPPAIARRALARVLCTVSGAAYPPRGRSLDRLLDRLLAELCAGPGGGRTLSGCRIVPWRGRILICREPDRVESAITLAPGASGLWDRRFFVTLGSHSQLGPAKFTLGALGADGWRQIRRDSPADLADSPFPAPVRLTLPAVSDLDGVVAVPTYNMAV